MNDTTKWIMIILLLLLIAAAVFVLLRSPGKDNGDAAVGGGDADRDGVRDAQENRLGTAGGTADRGVYDQEADARRDVGTRDRGLTDGDRAGDGDTMPAAERMDEYAHPDAVDDTQRRDERGAAPVESSDHDDTTTTPVEGRGTDLDDTDRTAEPYHPEAGAAETPAAGTTDVHPLTDDEIVEGGREEPLTRQDQEPGVSPEDSAADQRDDLDRGGAAGLHDEDARDHDRDHVRDDRRSGIDPEGPDVAAAAAAGAAGAAGTAGAAGATAATSRDETPREDAGYHQDALYRDGTADRDTATGAGDLTDDQHDARGAQEYPVGEESTTYRASDGDAVVVDRDTTGTGASEADTTHAGWDASPADTGTGAPQTADEIVGGRTDPERTDPERTDPTTTPSAGYAPVHTEAAYGSGSAEPLEDGSGPAGWEVKGNIGSMLFHTPESPSYDSVRAEVWFESEEAARNAGFAHWDRRRR